MHRMRENWDKALVTLRLCMCEMKWEGDLICFRERFHGFPQGNSRGNGSAPSSTVLLRWWMERSVWRMLSVVALARAAASEQGQLLWRGETAQLWMGQTQKSSYSNPLWRPTGWFSIHPVYLTEQNRVVERKHVRKFIASAELWPVEEKRALCLSLL